jgi:heat shock protein HslJ
MVLVALFSQLAQAQSRSLNGPKWVLKEMNGSNVGQSAAFIQFGTQPGRFGGNTGCNIMSGKVAIAGNKIVFSDVITTKRACLQGKPSLIDAQVTRIFGKSVKYSLTKGILTLSGGEGVTLKFSEDKSVAAQPSSGQATSKLDSRKWMLESISGKPISSVGKGAFIVFDPVKGSAGGDTSCNVFGGSYTTKGDKLKITETISTMRACIEDERMSIERGFLDGVRDVDRFEIKGDKLFLYKGRTQLLVFTGVDK